MRREESKEGRGSEAVLYHGGDAVGVAVDARHVGAVAVDILQAEA